ncbi:MAG: glycosyltransferase family 2 protein [Rickettsiaceae bacterium]|nr:glycosyltransferase family 2 protein [Rickettsiaceae bacterium]
MPKLFARLSVVECQLNQRDIEVEYICVDDGSGDNSLLILRGLKVSHPNIKIIKFTRNFGAISAIKSSLEFVQGDCFLFIAADLQDPPELIPEMVDRWLKGAKYVICERINRSDPLMTRFFAAIYYSILRLIVIKKYPKKGFDLALMDKQFLLYLRAAGKHVSFPLLPFWLGYEPSVIEYNREARKDGISRWTFGKKWKLMIDSIFAFSVFPIRFISLAGLIVSTVSFVYGAIVVVSAIIGSISVPGYASVVSLISFLLGLIILMLGVLGEIIWRIFDEVNMHPYAVIDEIY